MPFKDPEVRKVYCRENMRRWRARQPKQLALPTERSVLGEREYKKQWHARNPEKMKAYQKKYRATHPRTEKNRQCEKNYKLRKAYGITASDYEELLAKQGGRCAICNKLASDCLAKRHKYLAVDHDHVTGAVRGLLCTNCNRGIGSFEDNQELLRKAIEYLQEVARAS